MIKDKKNKNIDKKQIILVSNHILKIKIECDNLLTIV